jgi:putative phosphoribosyl transferase
MFEDRKDAAIQLAYALEKYKNKNVLVLGILRGGAETGYYVALHLGAEFSVLVARKLGYPPNPEYALGAIAEDGSIYMNEAASETISQETVDIIADQQQKEIERRVAFFRNGEPLPELRDRTVILVDDGIATGATLFASIAMCRNKGVHKLIVAAPVSAKEKEREIQEVADEVVILEKPAAYYAVSQAYQKFSDLTDEEALAFMEKWKKQRTSD